MSEEQAQPVGEQQERQRRASDTWRGRMETVGWFVNKVGLGAALAIMMLTLIGGILYMTFTGQVEIKKPHDHADEAAVQPSADERIQLLQAVKDSISAMTENHEAQTKVMLELVNAQKETTLVLRNLRCDLKPTHERKLRCFQRVAQGGSATDE